MHYMDKEYMDNMRLRLDVNNMMAEFVGKHGITEAELEQALGQSLPCSSGISWPEGENNFPEPRHRHDGMERVAL